MGEPFRLISHKGDTITEKIFSAKPTILFFGFTNCPEVCPTTLYEISSWIEELNLSSKDISKIQNKIYKKLSINYNFKLFQISNKFIVFYGL